VLKLGHMKMEGIRDYYYYVIDLQSINKFACSFMMSFDSSSQSELQVFESKDLRRIFRLNTD